MKNDTWRITISRNALIKLTFIRMTLKIMIHSGMTYFS